MPHVGHMIKKIHLCFTCKNKRLQLAQQLKPLFGSFTNFLFGLGLWNITKLFLR
jgi:hypothetical protein